jgi:RimJ/RimL family protein N-acetyltransferase
MYLFFVNQPSLNLELIMTDGTKKSRVFWRKGKKTMLCPLETNDADTVYRGINNPDAYSFLLTTQPKGLEFQKEWIASKQKPNEKDITVGICTLEGELIGTMGLHHIDHQNGTAVTGSVIFDEKNRNQGYGTDAKMVLLDYAFNLLGLHLVISRALGFNGRSAAYSQKCGYVVEARLRGRYVRFGQRYDEIILSVTRDEWLPLWEEYKKDL